MPGDRGDQLWVTAQLSNGRNVLYFVRFDVRPEGESFGNSPKQDLEQSQYELVP
jgi:hypothetical protein